MTVASVLSGGPVSLEGLDALIAILTVIEDKKAIAKAIKPIIEEREKLSAERAAVGSLQQIKSLREEASLDRDKASDELRHSIIQRDNIVEAAETKANAIIEKAEAAANKNVEWAAELNSRQIELDEGLESLGRERKEASRREKAAAKAKTEADELIKEAEGLKQQFQNKLDAMAKLQAA